ncbi:hypothetical protein PFISCL1PPCAC_21135, partial [Pristionchus fissidentatus]
PVIGSLNYGGNVQSCDSEDLRVAIMTILDSELFPAKKHYLCIAPHWWPCDVDFKSFNHAREESAAGAPIDQMRKVLDAYILFCERRKAAIAGGMASEIEKEIELRTTVIPADERKGREKKKSKETASNQSDVPLPKKVRKQRATLKKDTSRFLDTEDELVQDDVEGVAESTGSEANDLPISSSIPAETNDGLSAIDRYGSFISGNSECSTLMEEMHFADDTETQFVTRDRSGSAFGIEQMVTSTIPPPSLPSQSSGSRNSTMTMTEESNSTLNIMPGGVARDAYKIQNGRNDSWHGQYTSSIENGLHK